MRSMEGFGPIPSRRRPSYETLEDRSLLAVATWTGATSDDWTVASNWQGNYRPLVGDTIVLGAAPRKNLTNVGGEYSRIDFSSPGYSLNGAATDELIVSFMRFSQTAGVNVKVVMQPSVDYPLPQIVFFGPNRVASIGELTVSNDTTVNGSSYRLDVGTLELQANLTFMGSGIQRFATVDSLKGSTGILESLTGFDLQIYDAADFSGSILAEGGELQVSGDFSDAYIEISNDQAMYVAADSSLGTVDVGPGSTLYADAGNTYYGVVTVSGGGTLQAGWESSLLSMSQLNLSQNSTVNLVAEAATGDLRNARIQVDQATLGGSLYLYGNSKISKYESLSLISGNLTGAFSSLGHSSSVDGRATLDFQTDATGVVATGRLVFVNSTADAGVGTLRDAINRANQNSDFDHIYFDLPSGNNQQIALSSELPWITQSVYVHGLYAVDQQTTKSAPWVGLSGSQISSFTTGLALYTNQSTIQGLSLTGFSIGLRVLGSQNDLLGNYLGVRTDGSFAANQVGVSLVGSENQIGSGLVQDRNYFVACQATSIEISSNSQFNRVFGNWIGLGPNGESSDNSGVGVSISSSQGNVIGTNGDGSNDELEGNVLSGNSVGISLNFSTNTRISGNKIGTTPDGDARMPNRAEGISDFGSFTSLIGTNGDGVSDALERNIISGNNQSGIFLHNSSQFRVAGNYIGTTATGLVSLGNNSGGITMIGNSHDNVIGTDSSSDEFNSNERNLISGNQGLGIGLYGSGVSNNVIAGNWIGLSSNGSDPLGNSIGIDIYNAVQTRMGTNGDGFIDEIESNIVSGNSTGINLTSDAPWLSDIFTAEDLIAGRIQSAIHTANLPVTDISDATFPSGSNWAYDLPVPGGGGENYAVQVTGTIQVAVPGIYSFAAGSDDGTRLRIDGTIVIDYPYPRGFGVSYGQIELSAGDHTFEWISYEQGGAAGYELSVSPIAGNTADITEANGWKVLGDSNPHSEIQIKPSTSMTAKAYYVTGGYKLYASIAGNYIGTDPSGTSSIANGMGVNLGGASAVSIGGAQSSMRNVISGNQGTGIGGYVPTDIEIQNNVIGLNGTGQDPLGNGYAGIDFFEPRGLQVKDNIIGSNYMGFRAQTPTKTVFIGNTIGLAVDGLTPRSNGAYGLAIFQGNDVRIGTDGNGVGDVAEGNLISANGLANIYFSGANLSVAGNTIGTNKNYGALSDIPNGNGITLQYASNVRLGTDGSQDANNLVERNVVSGNKGDGIFLGITSSVTIAGNLVGVSPEDTSVGNANSGIRVNDSQNVVVGTNGDGSMDQIEGNVSSGNLVGIMVFGQQSSGNRVSGNRVGTNIAGTAAFPNLFTGIWLWYSDGTIVGTDGNGVSDDLERNVSSGNVGNGVSIENASYNRIAGNYLGTSANGLAAIPNTNDGVRLGGRMTGNIIGTDSSNDAFNANERNLISGNNTFGIATQSSANKNIIIAGNWIGLDASGNAALPNGNSGVQIENSTEVRIGTNGDGNYDALERNVMSGNLNSGIGFSTNNAQVYGMPMVEKLLAGQVPTIQVSGTIPQADLSDATNPENGVWSYDHAVPGGGGDDYAVVVTGTIEVTVEGTYSFAMSGSDGGRLRIGGLTVIYDDAIHGYQSAYGQVALTTGTHSFEWIGFERDWKAGWELSVSNTSNNTSSVSSANGWKVLGDPNPHNQIRLTPNTLMSVTTYKVNGYEEANLQISGNYVGTNASGNAALPNVGYGIYGRYARSFGIGGGNPAMMNVVSGNNMRLEDLSDFTVQGNIGGLDKTGTSSLGIGEFAILNSSRFKLEGNLLGGTGTGISIHQGSDGEVIGNSVGFAADGLTPRPSGGINVYNSTRIIVGTDGDGQNDVAEGNLVGATSGRPANITIGDSTDIAIAGNIIGTTKNYTAIPGLASGVSGISISGSSNVLIGTDGSDDAFNAAERNVISGNTSSGIAIEASSNLFIAGNLVGITPESMSLSNSADGLYVNNSSNVVIGTNSNGIADTLERNIISGNLGSGVWLRGGVNNTIAGNFIGTDRLGQFAIPNQIGVLISDNANLNIVGGTQSSGRNLISGNLTSGVALRGNGTVNNIIRGNWIGTDATGSVALANEHYGIQVAEGAAYTSILSNLVSGNILGGILIDAGGSNTLRGNWIGTDSTGTLALGNGRTGSPRFGVKISGGNGNLVGGIEPTDRNVLSGNFGDGLVLTTGTFGNSVQGNAVGTNTSGTIVISNSAHGILLEGDSVVNNAIGGPTQAAGNLIYNNQASGLRLPGLTASTASQNLFDQNLYRGNLGLAIDIGPEGVTTNDANDTDSLPNAPGIVAAFLSTVGSVNSLVVQGYTRPGRTVQFYVSAPTASGRGQGTKRLASLTEGTAEDADNRTGSFPGLNDLGLGSDDNAAYYEFTIPLADPALIEFGDLISAIATGSTSEFGNIRVVGDVASNQAPQIVLPSNSVTIAAGDILQLSGSFVDTDSTRWSATVDYGDGSARE
ncbi:MAG: beta strand repeat-containing protein, partial [Pirellula sp.]